MGRCFKVLQRKGGTEEEGGEERRRQRETDTERGGQASSLALTVLPNLFCGMFC